MAKDEDLEARTGSYVAAGSDWSTDEKFWRTNYASRPYASDDREFEYFRSAYRYGHDAAKRHGGSRWRGWRRRCAAGGRSSKDAASVRGTRSRRRYATLGIG